MNVHDFFPPCISWEEIKQKCFSWARGWIKWPLEIPSNVTFFYSSVKSILSGLHVSLANSWSYVKWLLRLLIALYSSWLRGKQLLAAVSGHFHSLSMSFVTFHFLVTNAEEANLGKERSCCTKLSGQDTHYSTAVFACPIKLRTWLWICWTG